MQLRWGGLLPDKDPSKRWKWWWGWVKKVIVLLVSSYLVDLGDRLVDSDLLFRNYLFSNSVYLIIIQRRPPVYLFTVPSHPHPSNMNISAEASDWKAFGYRRCFLHWWQWEQGGIQNKGAKSLLATPSFGAREASHPYGDFSPGVRVPHVLGFTFYFLKWLSFNGYIFFY